MKFYRRLGMRIVSEKVIPRGVGYLRSGDTGKNVKEYADRITRYIPSEVVAAYLVASGFAVDAKNAGTWFIVIFTACIVTTPIYITRFTVTRKEAWTNSIMALLAFVVWAYASGVGFFHHLKWYDAPTASVVLILFTLVSGAVVPVSKKDPLKPELQ